MEVEAMVRPVVEAAGLELVEASFAREHGRRKLRVTIDREGGLDLDTIAEVSERISRRLDLEGFEPGPYELEVSSPGIERPLREPRDFARRIGRLVKVKTSVPVDGTRTHRGRIVAADADEVRIASDTGECLLRYREITSARTVFDWQDEKGGKR
jgi:ribosome maturation factor RimP